MCSDKRDNVILNRSTTLLSSPPCHKVESYKLKTVKITQSCYENPFHERSRLIVRDDVDAILVLWDEGELRLSLKNKKK